MIVFLFYVDNMLIATKNMLEIQLLKRQLRRKFKMKDLGAAKKIHRDRQVGKLYLSQKKYIVKVLEHFGMKNPKLVSTPLASHFRLSASLSPKTKEEEDEIS